MDTENVMIWSVILILVNNNQGIKQKGINKMNFKVGFH